MTQQSDNRPQINLKLPAEQKHRWQQAADANPEYSSLSHLIRTAVEHELATADRGPDTTAGVDADVLAPIREVAEENRETLTDIHRLVTAVFESTKARDPNNAAMAEVWSVLPGPEESGEGLTPSEIADELGGPFDGPTVAGYLASMRDEGHVETTDGTHYRRAD